MQIKAPDLGVESAEVSEIMVSVGDVIAKDDNIILLESDKASVEVPSSAAGKVTNILVAVGDQVSEGSVLIEISADESEESSNQEHSAGQVNDEPANTNIEQSESVQKQQSQEQQQESATSANTINQETAAKSTTYALPDIGVDEAEVAEVLVAVGDVLEADQSILLIESDKASVEVPAPAAGKVEKILIQAGDQVKNGQDFIVISGAASSDSSDNIGTDKAEQQTAAEPTANQDKVETDSAKPANTASKQPSQAASISSQSKLSEAQVNEKLTEVYAGPAVRKLARQLGVDITQVSGSAVNDRIIKEDVFAYVKESMKAKASAPQAASAATVGSGLPNLPDMSKADIWGELETQDLSRLQKVSIPQLNYNTYLPQVTQFDLSDITETEKLRGELKGDFKKQGIGLTILAFIVKATAYALMQHPKFNSHLSDDNTQLIIRKTVNMGIAVATDDGLIVPVIKDAQSKGIKQLAIEIGELAAKARDKKLGTKDLQGASFTISSQGNLGGTYFTPLVNWPQVGILGVSEATKQPRWNEQKQSFEPRLMLPLSLSYDHRVINGADAAVFTRYLATLLADPRRILL
ncbi:2-oxo acid dehydrogenase subunit E2 [Psychrobacter sp. I-STPA10]|uniref:2-oxo acid dehydrogenase subunit E2 n=1 Tax=Psychrobacter sp. I-STPA10 TaxID=2585769 RepID=UPI001E3AB8B3|nr:2-oxo acid dehydrogenase subunit E2 [Psychrobacter sp. I-STPA10]